MEIEVDFCHFGRAPNPMDFCPRPTKKTKKYAVTKKSRTFAAENEYYLFT